MPPRISGMSPTVVDKMGLAMAMPSLSFRGNWAIAVSEFRCGTTMMCAAETSSGIFSTGDRGSWMSHFP